MWYFSLFFYILVLVKNPSFIFNGYLYVLICFFQLYLSNVTSSPSSIQKYCLLEKNKYEHSIYSNCCYHFNRQKYRVDISYFVTWSCQIDLWQTIKLSEPFVVGNVLVFKLGECRVLSYREKKVVLWLILVKWQFVLRIRLGTMKLGCHSFLTNENPIKNHLYHTFICNV